MKRLSAALHQGGIIACINEAVHNGGAAMVSYNNEPPRAMFGSPQFKLNYLPLEDGVMVECDASYHTLSIDDDVVEDRTQALLHVKAKIRVALAEGGEDTSVTAEFLHVEINHAHAETLFDGPGLLERIGNFIKMLFGFGILATHASDLELDALEGSRGTVKTA